MFAVWAVYDPFVIYGRRAASVVAAMPPTFDGVVNPIRCIVEKRFAGSVGKGRDSAVSRRIIAERIERCMSCCQSDCGSIKIREIQNIFGDYFYVTNGGKASVVAGYGYRFVGSVKAHVVQMPIYGYERCSPVFTRRLYHLGELGRTSRVGGSVMRRAKLPYIACKQLVLGKNQTRRELFGSLLIQSEGNRIGQGSQCGVSSGFKELPVAVAEFVQLIDALCRCKRILEIGRIWCPLDFARNNRYGVYN
ncbi:hypothetical protein D3C77_291950 [compost metagenome]